MEVPWSHSAAKSTENFGTGKGTPYLTSEVPLPLGGYSPRKLTVCTFYPPLYTSASF